MDRGRYKYASFGDKDLSLSMSVMLSYHEWTQDNNLLQMVRNYYC